MSEQRPRYSDLAPLTLDQRISLACAAINFFGPLEYRNMCKLIGKEADPKAIKPLSGRDFIDYLSKTGKLPEADKHLHRIRELLRTLADSNILTPQGPGRDILIGEHYYSMKERTNLEAKGAFWLAPALGPDFIYHLFSESTCHVTGITPNGDEHAGTGLAIAPNWLLTCAHVLEDMEIHPQQKYLGQTINVVRAVPHQSVDIGLIEVEPSILEADNTAFREPHAGEELFTLGFPRIPLARSPALIMHRGEVTCPQIETFDGHKLFLFSAIARPGNSGGPIISSSGHVLGVVTKELSEHAEQNQQPFFSGIGVDEIKRAVAELECGVELPVEDYQ